MEAVILSSPSLDGQEVFLRFTPSGQTEYIDLGLVLLPYTFYFESLVPPLANKAGVFFIYCTGLQCTYEVVVNDIPPTPTPSNAPTPTPSITTTITPTLTQTPTKTETPTVTPTITQTPTNTETPTSTPVSTQTPTVTPTLTPSCSVIPNLSVINLSGFVLSSNTFGDLSENIITISGSNTSIGQSLGNTYYWYSGSTDITPTGNTQVISFNLSEHLSAFTISFVCINSLGCGNTLPITIVPFLPAYIDILNITDDNGCGNGSVTFQVVGGYPPPPYGSYETYFVYDESFSHTSIVQTDTPTMFSGYSSGTTQLFASYYTYGASPSTAFTINYVPCDPLPSLVVFNGGPYCEGSGALFFIFADPDVSWEFINPSGVTIQTGTGNGGYNISPVTFSDSGTYTLTGCSSGGCYVQTFDYLTVNPIPIPLYTLESSPTTSISSCLSSDGYFEITFTNGDPSVSLQVGDGSCLNTFGSLNIPIVFTTVGVDTTFFSWYDGNTCGGFNYYSFIECPTLPVVNFSASTPSPGDPLDLVAYGGVTYRFFSTDFYTNPFDVTVSGDPITGATVSIPFSAQTGNYAVQVTDSGGCKNYGKTW